jgi:hypothetical protein
VYLPLAQDRPSESGRQSRNFKISGDAARLLLEPAHDLFRKPVPIPDQVDDKLFGIMR